MTLSSSLKAILVGGAIQVGLLSLASIVLLLLGTGQHSAQQLAQLWAGGMLGGLNVMIVMWSVVRAMTKKPIALTVAVSVFKYGFLIAIFWLATQAKVNLGGTFFVGLFLMLPSIGVVLFIVNKTGKSWFTSIGHN